MSCNKSLPSRPTIIALACNFQKSGTFWLRTKKTWSKCTTPSPCRALGRSSRMILGRSIGSLKFPTTTSTSFINAATTSYINKPSAQYLIKIIAKTRRKTRIRRGKRNLSLIGRHSAIAKTKNIHAFISISGMLSITLHSPLKETSLHLFLAVTSLWDLPKLNSWLSTLVLDRIW